MKILLFGKSGQLGWELQRSLAPLGLVTALGKTDAPGGDFTRPEDVVTAVRTHMPDVIVNAAAYTAVEQAESDAVTANAVNALTPGYLAQVAGEMGALLVHYSTDYVFNGHGQAPWRETDPVDPLNEYGRSKLEGERRIIASNCKHLIFRTSWVYAARGHNFVKTILQLAQKRDQLQVIDDQFGVPTGADLLADVTAHALRIAIHQPHLVGIYHVAPRGETTWHEYARYVIARARSAGLPIQVAEADVQAVSSTEFPSVAARPVNSRLDTSKLRDTFKLHLPHWQSGLDHILEEILARSLN